ncbi:MAG: Exoribonuclease [Pedosphaera sp.]|nr:Exoribonuclease [Pedosphaera sp.]
MTPPPIDLEARARQAMIQAGFQPDFPADITRELPTAPIALTASPTKPVRDFRSLLWSSIDNKESRDLDQIEYVERLPDGGLRLLIGIADVDAQVPKGSVIDLHAALNSTTVYTGVAIFPMLPLQLSTDATSLLNDCDRSAMVIELHILDSGQVDCHDVYPAWTRNRAKLAYGTVGAWLQGQGPMPPAIASVPGMEAQIRLQKETSDKLSGIRRRQGSLTFGSVEATPVVENGVVKDLVISQHNVAEDIIERFMVAANVAMAQHLKERGLPSLRRVVKMPKRWDRIQAIAAQHGVKLPSAPDPKALADFLDGQRQADPDHFPDLSLAIVKLLGPGEYIVETPGQEHEGHFGLAVQDYTHSTAPNRRYADLVTQRLLKAVAANASSPYSEVELRQVAVHCTEREDAARKVERLMRKIAACDLLRQHIGETYDGIITGASSKGTFVRLLKLPAEGMVVRGAQGVDVGDKVRVQLLSVDMNRGFIDFARK